jgi:tRNA (mo5U34)-methyltransferase
MEKLDTSGDTLLEEALSFQNLLTATKESLDPDFPWYPYGSMSNFVHLRETFNRHPLADLVSDDSRVLDVGAADGDLAFFLESLGIGTDVIDNPPTNFNGLRGARNLKAALGSSIGIHEIDLDSQFNLPAGRFSLVVFLGILYHLKNPYFALERFAQVADHMLLSTRIARFDPSGLEIRDSSVAYLVGPDECNNDATNFWIFSEAGLRKILARTGWEILDWRAVGDTEASNPSDMARDERVFALVKSTRRPADQAL